MITEEYYNKRMFEGQAYIEIYKELDEYLSQKSEALRKEAEALNAKGEAMAADEYVEVTRKLTKAIAYVKLQNKLDKDYDRMLKDIGRLMKQYDFQKGK